jgi:hypothetical protein
MASKGPAVAGGRIQAPISADCPENQSPAGTRPNNEERTHELLKIAQDYPGWHAWQGTLGGVVYASRSRTSPPLVVRATTTDQLARAIEDAERERGLR